MTYKAIFFTVSILAALLGAVLLPHTPRIAAQVDCNATPSDPSCQSSPSDNSQPPSNNNNPPAGNSQPPQPSTQTCPDGSVIGASATCPTPPPPSQPSTQTGASNNTGNATASQVSSNNTDFVNTILAIHNRERAAVGVPPLVWSDTIAAGAKTWAEHLAQINQASIPHSPSEQRPGQGESIAYLGYYLRGDTLPLLVNAWVYEKKYYHPGILTQQQTGHYTQMVWRDTKEVGCGIARGSVYDYLVCRYSPPGNWPGQAPY